VALARYCMQARQVLFVPSGNSPGSHGMAGLAGLGLFRRRLLVRVDEEQVDELILG